MKTLAIILSFFIGLVVFVPKENLFFTLQKELNKQHICIDTKTKENLLSLKLRNSKIFVNNINFFNIQKTDILFLLLYNKINIENIKIDFKNLKINHLNIIYSVLNPLNISIKGSANFANIEGNIDLKTKKLKVYLLNLTNSSIKSFLKKDKKGYFYVQTF